MRERMLKFFLMAAAVIVVGTVFTVLNLKLGKNSLREEKALQVDFARLETMATIVKGLPEAAEEEAFVTQKEAEPETQAAYGAPEKIRQTSAADEMYFMTETEIDGGSFLDLAVTEELVAAAKEDAEAYYIRLSEMDKKISVKAEEAAKKSVADQKTVADEALKFWDDELNAVYQDLREKMSEEEFAALREEERAWIRSRDEAANMAAAGENYSNSAQSLVYTRSLAEWTKERVYELAEMYFGK